MSSCFCRTCLIQMALKTPLRGRVSPLRAIRLRNDIKLMDIDCSTDGNFFLLCY